jgi:hypothetical protein
VRGGVFGSAWLVAGGCRLGAWMQRPAPACAPPAGAAARSASGRRIVYLWCRRALILTACANQSWGG